MTQHTAIILLACLSLSEGCYGKRPTADAGAGGREPPPTAAGKDAGPSSDGAHAPSKRDASTAHPSQPSAASTASLAPTHVEPEPNLRVAFFGDQSIGPAAVSVLELVAREHAQLVVHAGDLSYQMTDPAGWEAQINAVLGRDFPYLVAIGNHDVADWEGPAGFAAILKSRLARTPEVLCNGELGVKSLCRYRGVEVVLSGVGVYGTDHEWYLESTLSRPGAPVRLCVWHENQHDMQVGAKTDEVGWAAYKICARHAAPIITGHEHSYARSYALTEIGNRKRQHGRFGPPSIMSLMPDTTVVVVAGLGGHSSRTRTSDHESDSWWASIYANDYQMKNGEEVTKDAHVDFGALFIDFNIDNDPLKARAVFKTTTNKQVDEFELHFAPRD